MIAPGASTRYTMTPKPAGFRWYHTHTFAGKNLTKAQYGGLHGFLLIENGKTLGSGDPVKVKPGERVMVHILNSSPTEVHWISFSGHSFKVVALDGNPVAQSQTVEKRELLSRGRSTDATLSEGSCRH
jgi:FtsP/CotA-like multicopper oxidase with cupredoxin domain